jgi:hypothetical protein
VKPVLTEQDFQDAADQLGCEVAAIKAVCQVEAPRGGFLPSGEPTILFERHKFSKFTGRKFDMSHSHISNRKPGGYKGGQAEHDRLAEAVALDRDAALRSASWGKFQIMGFNHEIVGFDSIQKFVNAMYKSEREHLMAFVLYVLNTGLAPALRRRDWPTFAEGYNGPGYAGYDTKMAAAYTRFKRG